MERIEVTESPGREPTERCRRTPLTWQGTDKGTARTVALRADDVDLGRDRDLVARYQNGDPEAFDDLYRCYFNRLRRYCQRHTSDRH